MATHSHSTIATAAIWPDLFGRIADIPASDPRPDAELFTLCTEFHRADIALAAIPSTDEQALDAAWEARQRIADRLMTLRPTTDAGRRAKASVGVTILSELAPWQRDSEVMFALAVFRAEAFA